MAGNFIQSGHTITFAAPYQRNSGQAALLGTLVGIALGTFGNGASGEWGVTGVWDVEKVSAQAWTQGAIIYWDDVAKNFTTTSTGNTRAGMAVLAAANPSSTGRVRLNATGAPTGA